MVGHTEATIPNALFRLSSLALDQYLAKLYAIEPTGEGHPDPQRFRELELLKRENFVSVVPLSKRKPNADLLLGICAEWGVLASQAAYVGDSLIRDVSMAKAAGVWAAWARYGTRYDEDHWTTLVRVTHWTKEDVQREVELKKQFAHIVPDIELRSFNQLLEEFVFSTPVALGRKMG